MLFRGLHEAFCQVVVYSNNFIECAVLNIPDHNSRLRAVGVHQLRQDVEKKRNVKEKYTTTIMMSAALVLLSNLLAGSKAF